MPVIVEAPAPGSKRRLPGRTAAGGTTKPQPMRRTKTSADLDVVRPAVPSAVGPCRLDLDEPDPAAAEIDRLIFDFNGPLWNILSRCPSQDMRRAVARAFIDYQNFPGSEHTTNKWFAALAAVEQGSEYL
ncbi:MAG: hypothetical protein WCJ64_17160 [Rhodospirillaceae bacterium]